MRKSKKKSGKISFNIVPKEAVQAKPLKITCSECSSHNVIIDTGVCSLPKGNNPEKQVIHQTICLDCSHVGGVCLTSEQVEQLIRDEEELTEVMIVAGKL